jgi:hypothetical protein
MRNYAHVFRNSLMNTTEELQATIAKLIQRGKGIVAASLVSHHHIDLEDHDRMTT